MASTAAPQQKQPASGRTSVSKRKLGQEFVKVDQLNPGTSGHSLTVKVRRKKGRSNSDTILFTFRNEQEKGQQTQLSTRQRECIRFSIVQVKKNFFCWESVGEVFVNILEGLELHTGVFSAIEQRRIIDFVYKLQEEGKHNKFKERTYAAPKKWMRGKGRVTIQFGCCYNYKLDKNGNVPGILQNEMVDPIPPLFKVMIKRLVRWHVLPPSCIPDSCIVNIYDEGDCIPPHIDHHDFVRPFCTVSFLSECSILFGSNLKVLGPGDFSGAAAIPLPVGSVLVLNGNAADVAKHCVPAVPTKRISITFRKMEESKRPREFIPEPDLQGLQPLSYETERSDRATPSRPNLSFDRESFTMRITEIGQGESKGEMATIRNINF